MAKKSRAVSRRRRYFSRGVSRAKKMTLPLAVVAGFVPLTYTTYQHFKWNGMGGPEGAADLFVRSLTGFSPNKAYGKTFELQRMNWGLFPILAGMLVHKIAGRVGINRAIAGAGIPFIRI